MAGFDTGSKTGNGDTKRGDLSVSNISRAPDGLVNQRQRAAWEGMDLARNLVEMREKERLSSEKTREKTLLGLSEEEEILFLGNGSRLPALPVAILSAVFIALSSISSLQIPTGASFALLAAGLIGFLTLNLDKGRTKYYLTNFRAMGFKRSFFRKGAWTSVQYANVEGCLFSSSFFGRGVELWDDEDRLKINGLSRGHLALVEKVLRSRVSRTGRS